MKFLAYLFLFIAIGAGLILMEARGNNEIAKKLYGTSHNEYKSGRKKIIRCICIILLSITLCIVCLAASCDDGKKESEWGKLSKEENNGIKITMVTVNMMIIKKQWKITEAGNKI